MDIVALFQCLQPYVTTTTLRQCRRIACTIHHASRGGREQARDLPEPLDTFLPVDRRKEKSLGTVTHGEGVCAGMARIEQQPYDFCRLTFTLLRPDRKLNNGRVVDLPIPCQFTLAGESRQATRLYQPPSFFVNGTLSLMPLQASQRLSSG
jgi:hypothetical protein